jgi:hypothetical protein
MPTTQVTETLIVYDIRFYTLYLSAICSFFKTTTIIIEN